MIKFKLVYSIIWRFIKYFKMAQENKENLSPRVQAAIASTPSLDDIPVILKGETNTITKPEVNTSKVIHLDVKVDKNDETESLKKYFVRLPHSQYEFDVRGLLVKEEDEIKSSNTSTKRAATTIMKVLYNCISNDIKTPDHPFGTFEGFCRSISQADRDTIAMAVIEKTYESTHEMTVRCPRCNQSFDELISLNECMHYKYYTGEGNILDKRQVLKFPDINWTMYLKIPTLADELKTLNSNEQVEDLQRASEYIFVDKIDYVDTNERGQKLEESVTNYARIYTLIKNRPAIIRKRIFKEYDNFKKDPRDGKEYGVTGKFETTCKYCDSPITMNIVPISHFLSLLS